MLRKLLSDGLPEPPHEPPDLAETIKRGLDAPQFAPVRLFINTLVEMRAWWPILLPLLALVGWRAYWRERAVLENQK